MLPRLTAIGFDADDTLWHNERFFAMTQAHFADLLSAHTDKDHLMDRLLVAERRNLPHYGFGIKGFTLSMIETAIEITDGKVPAKVIGEILDAGRDMLSHEIELLPHAKETLITLGADHKLILITKGDLLDQTRKLEQSGLRDYFSAVEIVSHKTPHEYRDIFSRHGQGPDTGLMVGNSMASDVVPMIESGGWGVFCPHGLTWAVEHAAPPETHPRFFEITDLSELPDLVAQIAA
ncbi:HAD family hydrolase [Sulfitobacter aestuariivivens]|uniref:HAD hydrolase-like protein n=1 Tax=Sulfitobacter aestuariivivens TaxID=2766981 RepID=A0A927D8H0_9RHOB|nr:HAD family hydrolase [Sulfitobacter aestuariivivens]MBD3664696.1 HAD hydrolase-like protein [Sulfitobacter aestuariivivens]